MNCPSKEEFRLFLIRYERPISVAVLLLIFVWTVVITYVHNGWGDIDNYYRNISSVVDQHQMPYSEAVFEYPPLMLVFFLIPKLFSYDLASFHTSYLVFSTSFLFINCVLMMRITDRMSSSRHRTLFIMVSLIVFGNNFIFCRADIFVSAIVLWGILLYMDGKAELSSAVLAAGTMTKLYPVLIFAIIIAMIFMKHDWRRMSRCALIFFAVCLLTELPFLICDASTAFAYLEYHSDRGLQIQAVITSAFLLYNLLVPGSVTVVNNFYSDNIVNPVADAIASCMNIVTVIVILAFGFWMLSRMRNIRGSEENMRMCFTLMPIIVMIFIVFSKVYSAQYLIWAVTLLPLVYFPLLTDRGTTKLTVSYLGWGVFQFIEETYTYGLLCDLNPFAVLITIIKNAFLIMFLIQLILIFHMHTGKINQDR